MIQRVIVMCGTVAFIMCSCKTSSDQPAPAETVLTQTQLNAISVSISSDETGAALGGTWAIGHVLSNAALNNDPNSTFRDVVSNRNSLAGSLSQGDVIVKRVFLKDGLGAKAGRSNVYVMVKQYPGYYPEGGDFSYYSIEYAASVINDATPNGLIASANLSGKVALCANCHTHAAGGRFVYTGGSNGGGGGYY